jgi:hydrogenase-1 operon protein HyaF
MTASPNNGREAPTLTGMADAVLSEVAARLADFAETGATAVIELTSMPLTVQDRAALDERLGRGEVSAEVEAAGRSEVWETAFAGVWFVRHHGEGGRISSESIEVTKVPVLLESHPDDARAAARRLAEACAQAQTHTGATPGPDSA